MMMQTKSVLNRFIHSVFELIHRTHKSDLNSCDKQCGHYFRSDCNRIQM